jgi:hypothetical protein
LILGVGNLSIGVVKGHNSLGGKLPLMLVLQGNLLTKDVADASIGILVGVTRVLIMFIFGLVLFIRSLIILAVILVAVFVTAVVPFLRVRAVNSLQTPTIAHCMAVVRMSRAGTLKDLGIGILIIALGRWLDGVDGIINWSVAALLSPKVILPMLIMIVVVAVMVVIVPIITAVVATPIIWAAILLIRVGSLANVFLDLLVGLISICPLLCHREKVLN